MLVIHDLGLNVNKAAIYKAKGFQRNRLREFKVCVCVYASVHMGADGWRGGQGGRVTLSFRSTSIPPSFR